MHLQGGGGRGVAVLADAAADAPLNLRKGMQRVESRPLMAQLCCEEAGLECSVSAA